MFAKSYKEAHEDFVSNGQGSDIFRVLFCLMQSFGYMLIIKFLERILSPSIAVDLIFLAIPMLFTLTIWEEYNFYSFCSLLIVSILLTLAFTNKNTNPHESQGLDINTIHKQTSFITLFKGNM
jgi:flagellar biosynthesis component FlhA